MKTFHIFYYTRYDKSYEKFSQSQLFTRYVANIHLDI